MGLRRYFYRPDPVICFSCLFYCGDWCAEAIIILYQPSDIVKRVASFYPFEFLSRYSMLSVFVSPIQIVKQAVVSLTVQASITQTVFSLSCLYVVYELLQCIHVFLLSVHPSILLEPLNLLVKRDGKVAYLAFLVLA
jgi:hypothetical protein